MNFSEIEKKWQDRWEKNKIFSPTEDVSKKKYYTLEMFSYPSAAGLHIGHAFNYTIGDVVARFKLMQGYNVLHPVGYDSLGLPAENAAIKEGIHPEDYTKRSIANFMKQQKMLGLTYDWNRCISTSDPEYYRWDQWIFLKMFEKGLAYQKESAVNWCSNCNTVISNEQAQGGYCDRCNTKIEIKQMKQWFLKITDYADRLLSGHDSLNWPDKTISMQKNWIGKSFGNEIIFKINDEDWKIFTTRPDTIFGVTFMVVSAQHKDLMKLVTSKQKKEVEKFLENLKSVSEKEMADMDKLGVFTGSYAINPANGTKVPVYAGNFVVSDYGAGMVMAVPAHDKRDYEFAKKYGIEIKQVIENQTSDVGDQISEVRRRKSDVRCQKSDIGSQMSDVRCQMSDVRRQISDVRLPTSDLKCAYIGNGKLINSEQFNGLDNEKAKDEIFNWLKKKGVAKKVVNYRLRDWCISRQRYWGTPIPLIDCPKCGFVPVNESDLPVKLPKNAIFGIGNPLLTEKEWLNVKCPKCGSPAQRVADTMDTFVNSSWYFLRFCDPKNNKEIFDKEKIKYWMPVDLYIGGPEHACMHLLFHRFYTMFLHDIGYLDFEEPTPRLFHQGMINDENGVKMSKSKGNVVEPIETMKKYGVDTTRFFLMSEASPDKGFNWSDKGIQGSLRFINKMLSVLENIQFGDDSFEMTNKMNLSIKNITEEIENIDLRKASIELRDLLATIEKQEKISKKTYDNFLKLLTPFCPHICEELWEKSKHSGFISNSSWPVFEIINSKKDKSIIDLNEKTVSLIKSLEEKINTSKNKKVYVYVLPFELGKLDSSLICKNTGFEVKIYSVNDNNKYDPENKAKKAKPGMPSIYWTSDI